MKTFAFVLLFLALSTLAVRTKKREPVEDENPAADEDLDIPTTGNVATAAPNEESDKPDNCPECNCKDQKDPLATCPELTVPLTAPGVNPPDAEHIMCCPFDDVAHDGSCKTTPVPPTCPPELEPFQSICRPKCKEYNDDKLSCAPDCEPGFRACHGICQHDDQVCGDIKYNVEVCELETHQEESLPYTECDKNTEEFINNYCTTNEVQPDVGNLPFTWCYTKRPYHVCAPGEIDDGAKCHSRCWGPGTQYHTDCYNYCPPDHVRCDGYCVPQMSNVMGTGCHTLERDVLEQAKEKGGIKKCIVIETDPNASAPTTTDEATL